jgi:hypothetical protein
MKMINSKSAMKCLFYICLLGSAAFFQGCKSSASIVEELSVEKSNQYNIATPCKITYDGPDQRTGKPKKEIAYENIFNFTHEKLANYYKDRDYLKCYSSIGILDGDYYLYLKLLFDSKNAGKSYGMIPKEENMRIQLMNGNDVLLKPFKNATPRIDTKTNKIIYDGIFKLEGSQKKELKSTEIDKIGIMWTSGFETYDIYNIDLIKNQLACIDRK